jgi:membrane-associated phospholipid phosphatase
VSPLDAATLLYAAASGAVLLLRLDRVAHPVLLAGAHLALAALALAAPRVRRSGAVGLFLGTFYPLLLTVALYTEVGLLNVAGGTVHDTRVQAWEEALFGSQVSLTWIRAWPWPWLSALLHAGYLSYYAILAAAPLAPWLRGQREQAGHILLLMMATFYLCYMVFLVFPVAGPRYSFPPADNPATRTALARLTQDLLREGSAWGTAFPSSHVAVSLVAAVSAWRAWRPLGTVLVPAALLLTLGTVYGQLHYAVDAVAGAALALVVVCCDRVLRTRLTEAP